MEREGQRQGQRQRQRQGQRQRQRQRQGQRQRQRQGRGQRGRAAERQLRGTGRRNTSSRRRTDFDRAASGSTPCDRPRESREVGPEGCGTRDRLEHGDVEQFHAAARDDADASNGSRLVEDDFDGGAELRRVQGARSGELLQADEERFSEDGMHTTVHRIDVSIERVVRSAAVRGNSCSDARTIPIEGSRPSVRVDCVPLAVPPRCSARRSAHRRACIVRSHPFGCWLRRPT
jgi:hypothetical protein